MSKPLGHEDESGFSFVKEILDGRPTYAINFDRLQKHPTRGYIMFEFLLCEETQTVTPTSSHPNRYWNKNSRKFIALWNAARALDATLYLVNYAKSGSKHADEITAIEVLQIDEEKGITKEKRETYSRYEFGLWFRALNDECK